MKKSAPVSRSGRFAGDSSADVAQFTESISFDQRLWRPLLIAGSIAHSRMLAKIGVLTTAEQTAIEAADDAIGEEILADRFEWKPHLEDVHGISWYELTRRVPAGAKLHTGRSRNDPSRPRRPALAAG